MTPRLNTSTLGALPVQGPGYDRSKLRAGIVHLGIGGFHRAHQAVYTDALIASGDPRWGITGASLRSTGAHDALAPQDGLYTVRRCGPDGEHLRVIGSVAGVLALPLAGHRERLTDRLASADVQVVTLTITEKGYCLDADGDLDWAHPDIEHDLQHPDAPRSAPGVLAQGLARRAAAKTGPVTVLSCDNLSRNGALCGNAVRSLIAAQNADLQNWAAEQVSFPSSMVDRIVPQTQPETIDAFAARAGYRDAALIDCEPFKQWVIEDRFAGERPAWDRVGAQFARDVGPFERAKLRFLNASHSALAYLGLLAGYRYIHEALGDPTLARFLRGLMAHDITPAVRCPAAMDVPGYKASILERFGNAAVPYRTSQVGSDGSQKLPQRLYPTVAYHLQKGTPIARPCLVIAAWLACLREPALACPPEGISDPGAAQVAELAGAHCSNQELVSAIAQQTDLFGALGREEPFQLALTESMNALDQHGVLSAAAALKRAE